MYTHSHTSICKLLATKIFRSSYLSQIFHLPKLYLKPLQSQKSLYSLYPSNICLVTAIQSKHEMKL